MQTDYLLYALALFLMMLTAQVPLVVAALIAYLKAMSAVKEVHDATNSMKDALVEATDKAAFARGEKSERDKK